MQPTEIDSASLARATERPIQQISEFRIDEALAIRAAEAVGNAFEESRADIDTLRVLGLVEHRYGLRGAIDLMGSEAADVTRLDTPDGRSFILKVRSQRVVSKCRFQAMALEHLRCWVPSLPLPTLIPALDGAPIAIDNDDPAFSVEITTMLAGIPLASALPSRRQHEALGQMLALIDDAFMRFSHLDRRQHSVWDLAVAPQHGTLLADLPPGEDRDLAANAFAAFAARWSPAARATLRQQVIHGDFSTHNVLVDPDDHDRITGVFDFGDCVESALIHEVAIPCALLADAWDDPLAGPEAFLQGYCATFPLLRIEAEMLFDLMRLRLATLIAINRTRAAANPGASDHILKNVGRAINGLRKFAALDEDVARARLMRACGWVS